MSTEKWSTMMAKHIANGDGTKVEDALNSLELAKQLGINVVLSDPENPQCNIAETKSLHLGGVGQGFVNGIILSGLIDRDGQTPR